MENKNPITANALLAASRGGRSGAVGSGKRIKKFLNGAGMGLIFLLFSLTSHAQSSKKVYEANCLSCHQADGSGVPRLNPPLKKTKWVLGDKNELIDIILNGLDKEIEINGQYYNNPMPAQPHLSDQEIADVLTYIRSNFGNKANAITAAEVKKQRAKNK